MAILFLLTNDRTERLHAFDEGTVTLGRDASNTIVLPGPGVSRFHCRMIVQGPLIVMEDLGARHGVYLDGRRILGPVAVRDGAELQIASHVLLCRHERRSVEPPAACAAALHTGTPASSPHPPREDKPTGQTARFRFWWFFSWAGFCFGWTFRKKSADNSSRQPGTRPELRHREG